MLSMESSQTSLVLQLLDKLCAEYGKFSDIATGTAQTVCGVWKVLKHRYRYWKNSVLCIESSQTSLQVLEKLCPEYGKFIDIATGTGKTVC